MNGGLRGWVNEDTGEHVGTWTGGSKVCRLCVCACVENQGLQGEKLSFEAFGEQRIVAIFISLLELLRAKSSFSLCNVFVKFCIIL